MEQLFKTLTLSNVSENAMGSAVDCLNDNWSNTGDSDSDIGQAQPEVLEFLQPGAAQGAADHSPRPRRHRVLEGPVSKKAVADRTQKSPPQGGQQDILTRQNTGGSEFSRSSSSTWSQSDQMQSNSKSSSRVQCFELIGRGGFGSVYKGTWKGRPAAIKVNRGFCPSILYCQVVEHDDGLLGELDEFDDLVNTAGSSRGQLETTSSTATGSTAIFLEAAISSAVMHSNVVQTYSYGTHRSAATGSQETHVVMEWCEGGSLEAAVERGQFHFPPAHGWGQQADALRICATLLDIASGMGYLHQMHILHRDLKLKNVLLKTTQADWRGFIAKVSDFGLSQLVPDTPSQATVEVAQCEGTVTHLSPEVLSGSKHSTAADVYAFGILMYELWEAQPAFLNLSKLQVMVGVVSSDLRPQFTQDCPSWYTSLAAACWTPSAARRPSFANLIRHLERAVALLH